MGREIATIGDVNPIIYGGGKVFAAAVGGPWVEWFDGLEAYAEAYADRPDLVPYWLPVVVYRVDLHKNAREFLSWYDWVEWDQVADSTGVDIEDYTTPAKLKTAQARALAIWDAAGYYGWHEFDQYPLSLTIDKLEKRWKTTR